MFSVRRTYFVQEGSGTSSSRVVRHLVRCDYIVAGKPIVRGHGLRDRVRPGAPALNDLSS